MPSQPLRSAIIVAASLLAALFLSDLAIAGQPDQHLDNVRLTLVGGSSIKASIEKIEADGSVRGKNLPDNLQADQITGIDTGRDASTPSKLSIAVRLVDGGVIYCNEVSANDDRLIAENAKSRFDFPLEVVRAIVWQTNNQTTQLINQPAVENDSVVVQTSRGQQIVQGILQAIDQTHVRIKFEGESKRISRDIVRAVVTADLKLNPPKGLRTTAKLVDGSAIVGTLNSFEAGLFKFNLSGGNVFDVRSVELAQLNVASDRVAYLSDMNPVEVEESSQFAAPRPWQRDLSVTGSPLRLKFVSTGKTVSFDKGLGTKPYTRLVFENQSDFDQLRAIAGIDTKTAGRGDCEMIVRGDGIQLWAKRVRGTDDPEPIVVDITGMSKISLIVLPGENFDLSDHANWADAKFTKTN